MKEERKKKRKVQSRRDYSIAMSTSHAEALQAVAALGRDPTITPEVAAAFALGFVQGKAGPSSSGASAPPTPSLEDSTVCVSPYFKVLDVEKFKAIWKAAYVPSCIRNHPDAIPTHLDSAVHYYVPPHCTRAHCYALTPCTHTRAHTHRNEHMEGMTLLHTRMTVCITGSLSPRTAPVRIVVKLTPLQPMCFSTWGTSTVL